MTLRFSALRPFTHIARILTTLTFTSLRIGGKILSCSLRATTRQHLRMCKSIHVCKALCPDSSSVNVFYIESVYKLSSDECGPGR